MVNAIYIHDTTEFSSTLECLYPIITQFHVHCIDNNTQTNVFIMTLQRLTLHDYVHSTLKGKQTSFFFHYKDFPALKLSCFMKTLIKLQISAVWKSSGKGFNKLNLK